MSSMSRSQLYENQSYDNQVYRIDVEVPSISGPSLPSRPPRFKSPGKKQSPLTDQAPVVYIDMDEMTGNSPVAAQSPNREQTQHNDFIQNTIFYNPFEDNKPKLLNSPDSSTSSSGSNEIQPARPTPANYLNLNHPETPARTRTPNPALNTTRTQYQSYTPDDGFTLTPIEVNEFPDPPPAYTENNIPHQISRSAADTIVNIPPPPAQVVTISNNLAMVPANKHRKILFCTRCGARVQTLVVRQPGTVTHWIACVMCMFCFVPCILGLYCTDCCKNKNHYCPNCNHLIGYEGLCQKKVMAK